MIAQIQSILSRSPRTLVTDLAGVLMLAAMTLTVLNLPGVI